MTKEDQAQALLTKYIEKKASPAEIQQVESWYASYETQETHLDIGRKKEMGAVMLLKLNEILEKTAALKAKRYRLIQVAVKVAAMIVLLSAVALSLWSPFQNQEAPENLLKISTTSREKKKILLQDGSEIVLGPSGCLLYPAQFKTKNRTVTLQKGAAFFEVAHEEDRPFTVKANNGIYTRVLGTSFRMNTGNRKIAVVVVTGKVAVGNAHQVFGTLIKGQQLSYDQINQRAEISYTPVKTYVNINFESTALNEVLQRIAYVYSIRIDLESAALKTLKCTASFNTKQSPEEILEVICSLHHLKLRTSDDHKTFKVYRK